jgi:hypothetical protein
VNGAPDGPVGQPPVGSPISGALRLYGRHWRTLVACAMVGILPVVALDAAEFLRSGVDPLTAASAREEGRAGRGTLSLIGAGLSLALYSLVSAACIHVSAEAGAGRDTDWRSALAAGARRAVAVLLAAVIVLVGVILGLLALVLPGIWLAVAWSVAAPAVVLEGAAPVQAVKRSFALVRGSWWYALGVLALGTLTAMAVIVAVAIPITVVIGVVEAQVGRVLLFALTEAVIMAILLPFWASVLTLLFFQLRARRDGPTPADVPPRTGAAPSVPPSGTDERFGGFEPPAAPGSR